MCIIIHKKKGAVIPDYVIDRQWGWNPHGAGFAVIDGVSEYYKGIMTLGSLYELLDRYNTAYYEIVLHFRYSSAGGISRRLTHPFPLDGYNKLRGRSRELLFHNGHLSFVSLRNNQSDTERLSGLLRRLGVPLDNKSVQGLLEATGSKFALVTNGKVIHIGQWLNYGNLLASAYL